MPSVVLDTVVLIRGLINPYGLWGRVVFDWAAHYRLSISRPLLTEYLEVMRRPELTRKFRSLPEHMHDLLSLLSQAEIVILDELPAFERDPKDAMVLATAVQAGADYIVSEDKDLLDLKQHKGITIVSAAAFLRLLEEQAGQSD